MEFSNQFKDSFRQGLIAGYFFTATFVIVFYMSYCLPTQIMKKRKKKNLRHKKIGEMHNHNSKQEKIKEVPCPFILDTIIYLLLIFFE